MPSSTVDPQLFADSTLPVQQARTLPPDCYTSDNFFAFEKDAVFGHDWCCVGRESWVADPGSYFTVELVEEPLIIVRGRDGRIRALSAVCRHRGMVIAEGSGTCKSFLCPYHHWVYGTDGRLTGAPQMQETEGFRKEDYSLPQLRVETWQGFIFVNFDDKAPPLAPTLSKVDPFLTHFNLETSVSPPARRLPSLPWNWKVMFENFNDSYHASRLHKGPHDFCPSENCTFTPWSDGDNAILRYNTFTHIDGGFNATTKALMPIFPNLTEEERWRVVFVLIPPTLCMGLAPDEVFYFLVWPESTQQISIDIGYCFDESAMRHPRFDLLFEAAEAGVKIFNDQDVYADTMVQRGLRSRFAPRGRYSWEEETLAQFNRWLVTRYQKHS